ncbi:MAG: LamG-like jellyroll fold domain-containing protein [bacterium]
MTLNRQTFFNIWRHGVWGLRLSAVGALTVGALFLGPSSGSADVTNGVLSFTRVNDTVQIGGQTELTNAVTFEAVFRLAAANSTGAIFNEWTADEEDKQLWVGPNILRANGILSGGNIDANVSVSVDAWHHVAYVYDGSEQRFYLDGVLVSNRATSGNFDSSSGQGYLGGNPHPGWSNSFIGCLDSFRISTTARYAGASFTPPQGDIATDPGTALLYNFNESPGSSIIYDLSGNGHTGTLGTGFSGATAPALTNTCALIGEVLTNVAASGAAQVIEGTTNAFTATAQYANGSSLDVTATAVWSVVSGPAGTYFTNGNQLVAGAVSSNTEATIRAVYADGGITKTGTLSVTVLDLSALSITDYFVNGGVNVSDGQVTGGTYSVVHHIRSEGGVETTNTAGGFFQPHFDIWNSTGTQIQTDKVYGSFTYLDSGKTLIASNGTQSVVAPSAVTLGAYTTRVSAIGSNGVFLTDSTTLSNGTPMTFTVYDDDTNNPMVAPPASEEVNLLSNFSIEDGVDNWVVTDWNMVLFNSSRETTNTGHVFGYADGVLFPHGSYALKGWGGSVDLSQSVVVEPGAFYHAYGQFYHNPTEDAISPVANSTRMFIHLEWRDAGGETIANNYSAFHNGTSPADSWQFINMWSTAPENAATVVFHVETDHDVGGGSLFGDDFHLGRAGRELSIWIGTNNLSSKDGVGTWVTHTIYDGQLAGVAATNPLRLVIGACDTNSGLSRGTTDTNTQMSLDFENWLTNNVTNYLESASTPYADTTNTYATSVWEFVSSDLNAIYGKTSRVTVTLFDADADRTNDQAVVLDQQYGWIRVNDDDTGGPSQVPNVTVDVEGWTNINLFNVTFSKATDDVSGVYQYRYDTNVVASAYVTNGEVVSGIATTELAAPAFSNRSFEIGSRGDGVPDDPANRHGWRDYSSDNASGIYWNVAQAGTSSMRHVIDEGDNAGSARYTLIGQQVAIDNTNSYPMRVWMSAWFSGDVSRVANSVTGAAFLRMEFFDASTTLIQTVDNEWGNDHNGKPLEGVNCTGWSNVVITATNGPASTRYMRFTCGVAQHGTDLPYTGYWDNVAVTVKVVGAVGEAYSFPMTNALEGIRTNWLFAVDDDDDRPNDRLKGNNTNFLTRLDQTAPPMVTNFSATNGVDTSSQVSLIWSALANAGNRAGDNEPLSPWRTYYIFYSTNAVVTTNDASATFANGYPTLSTNTTSSVVITNLQPNATYRFVIMGEDRAGNMGSPSATATVTTVETIFSGMDAYFPFDGDALDASGNGHHGTNINGVTYGSGVSGQAAVFDGNDDYVQVAAGGMLSYNANTQSYSVSLWLKVNAFTNAHGNLIFIKDRPVGQNTWQSYGLGIWTNVHRLDNDVWNGTDHDLLGPVIDDYAWHHIALVVMANSQQLMYADGALVAVTNNIAGIGPTSATNQTITIGAGWYPTGMELFNGLIDEVRIFGRALVSNEVSQLYVLGGINLMTNVVASGAAQVQEGSTSAFSATAQYADGSSSNVSTTGTWSVVSGPAGTYFTNGNQLVAGAVSSNTEATIRAVYADGGITKTGTLAVTVVEQLNWGMQAYFPFDGDSLDASGNGHHGTNINGVTYGSGVSGQAAIFDGNDDYVQVAAGGMLSYNANTQSYSVSMWFKVNAFTNSNGNLQLIKDRPVGQNTLQSYGLGIGTNLHRLDNDVWNGTDHDLLGPMVEDYAWHHVALVVLANSQQLMYADGVLVAVTNNIAGIGSTSATNATITIGSGWYPTGMEPFNGSIDEVRIYDRALVSNEVVILYAPNTGTLHRLVVVSAHDSPQPPVGTSLVQTYMAVTNTVTTPADETSGVRYVSSGWTMMGNEPLSGSTNTFVMTITNDCTLTWLWVTQNYLDTAAGTNGSVNVGDGWYTNGSLVSITATPSGGYHFVGWSGTVASVQNPLAVTMTNPVTAQAFFDINTYVITATAGPYGTISPPGSVPVPHGASTSFLVQAAASSHIAEVYVDGSPVGGFLTDSTSYTHVFSGVTTGHAISAQFNHFPEIALTAGPRTGVAPLRVQFDTSASQDPGGEIDYSEIDLESDGRWDARIEGVGRVVVSYGQAGIFTAAVRVVDAFGASASTNTTITVFSAGLTAALQAIPTNGSAPLLVALDASASTASVGHVIVTYEWDIEGDGVVDLLTAVPTTSWTYRAAGTYTARVRVTDDQGLKESAFATIVVSVPALVPPSVSLSAVPDSGAAPLQVNFTASASDDVAVVSYRWDFDGDGDVDRITTNGMTSYMYVDPGTYLPQVTVIDSDGLSASDSADIRVRGASSLRVWISTPKDSVTVWGSNVSVRVNTAPGSLTASVQLQYRRQDGTNWANMGGLILPPPYSFAAVWNVTGLTDGSNYAVRAFAWDTDGGVVTSEVITVLVSSGSQQSAGSIHEDNNNGHHCKQEVVDAKSDVLVEVYDGTAAFIPAELAGSNITAEVELTGSNTNSVNGSAEGLGSISENRRVTVGDLTLLSQPVVITIPYEDDDQDGMVDGTGIPENTLEAHWYDAVSNVWRRPLESEVLASDNKVRVKTQHLTEFGLFGTLNLLHPANGGILLAFSSEYTNTTRAVNLADGNLVSFWRSQMPPSSTQAFIYAFSNDMGAVVQDVVLHNYGEASFGQSRYSANFEIAFSMDGSNFVTATNGVLLAQEGPQTFQMGNLTCRVVRIAVSSGTDTQAWELAEAGLRGTLTPDADADGMADGWEKAYFGGFGRNGSGDFDTDDLTDSGEFTLTTNPNNPDTDGDGMIDGWEVNGSLNPLVNDANADNDGDRQANIEEYVAGTAPSDDASFFKIPSLAVVFGTNFVDYVLTNTCPPAIEDCGLVYTQRMYDPARAVFSWPSITGRIYSIDYATNLNFGVFQPVPSAQDMPATPPTGFFTNTWDGPTSYTFRIKVRLE